MYCGERLCAAGAAALSFGTQQGAIRRWGLFSCAFAKKGCRWSLVQVRHREEVGCPGHSHHGLRVLFAPSRSPQTSCSS